MLQSFYAALGALAQRAQELKSERRAICERFAQGTPFRRALIAQTLYDLDTLRLAYAAVRRHGTHSGRYSLVDVGPLWPGLPERSDYDSLHNADLVRENHIVRQLLDGEWDDLVFEAGDLDELDSFADALADLGNQTSQGAVVGRNHYREWRPAVELHGMEVEQVDESTWESVTFTGRKRRTHDHQDVGHAEADLIPVSLRDGYYHDLTRRGQYLDDVVLLGDAFVDEVVGYDPRTCEPNPSRVEREQQPVTIRWEQPVEVSPYA